jgi:phage tail-like protein
MVDSATNGLSSNTNTASVAHELNYVTTNRFYVELDNLIVASFTECSGLGVEIQKQVYYEGGVNDQQRIFLEHASFTDVTLKRGLTDHQDFWGWLIGVFDNAVKTQRNNVNILVFNQAGEIMQSWTLIGAIPVGWKAPALQADGNAVAIEELTLAFEGLNVGRNSGGGIRVQRDGTGYFPSS